MLLIGAITILALQIFVDGFNIMLTWLLYGLPYLIMEFVYIFSPKKREKIKFEGGGLRGLKAYLKSDITVYPFFILQIAVLYFGGAILFYL